MKPQASIIEKTARSAGRVGIVGLGLIGGSFAKAYRDAGWEVYAFDTDESTMAAARVETIAGELDENSLPLCSLIILAAYPQACLDWLGANAEALGRISNPPIVIDAAGVKRPICDCAFSLAKRYGFVFVGAHPMAGTEFSGFAHARANLFVDAPMVLVPPEMDDIDRLMTLDRLVELLRPVGFGSYCISTADEHDEVIAYTSQLAHIVSNAYVKSPAARGHHGFSAGSYRDLTRVARLNPAMWAELMTENSEALEHEVSTLIDSLEAYRKALASKNEQELKALLAEGDRIKRTIDGGQEADGCTS